MTAWLQLRLATTAAEAEFLSDQLMEAGAVAVTFEDAADQPLYEPAPDTTPLWEQIQVVALLEDNDQVSDIIGNLQQQLGDKFTQYRIERLPNKDWERAWMADWQPTRFGKRLWICPTWCKTPEPEAINVTLDPGLAFGTGTHPTTALCLTWLDSQTWSGQKVIDYGCGSGILGIAALKLGASHVWAIDNDPQALEAMNNNASVNQLAKDCFDTLLPDQVPDTLPANLLLANILAEPLLQLAPRFAQLLPPGGTLVLSGILIEQVAVIQERYQAWFEFSEPVIQDNWAMLAGTRLTTAIV